MQTQEHMHRLEEQSRIEESEKRAGVPLDVLQRLHEINRAYLRINQIRVDKG